MAQTNVLRTSESGRRPVKREQTGSMPAIRTLILEYVDTNGASHIREMHIQVLQRKPGTPEHTVRARLSEAVSDGVLNRLGEGFYDVYAEDEGMTSVVSHPKVEAAGSRRSKVQLGTATPEGQRHA